MKKKNKSKMEKSINDKISINDIKDEKYIKAEKRFKTIQLINLITFFLNLFFLCLMVLYVDNSFSKTIINTYIVIILIISVIIFIWDNKYSKCREIAEELRMIQFNKANLQINISPEKKSYLLPYILSTNISTNNIEIDYEANYFENQNLKFSLLQNIFFYTKKLRVSCRFLQKNLMDTFYFYHFIAHTISKLKSCL